MPTAPTQPLLLFALFGKRVVPSDKCRTKKEQRKEVLRVGQLPKYITNFNKTVLSVNYALILALS